MAHRRAQKDAKKGREKPKTLLPIIKKENLKLGFNSYQLKPKELIRSVVKLPPGYEIHSPARQGTRYKTGIISKGGKPVYVVKVKGAGTSESADREIKEYENGKAKAKQQGFRVPKHFNINKVKTNSGNPIIVVVEQYAGKQAESFKEPLPRADKMSFISKSIESNLELGLKHKWKPIEGRNKDNLEMWDRGRISYIDTHDDIKGSSLHPPDVLGSRLQQAQAIGSEFSRKMKRKVMRFLRKNNAPEEVFKRILLPEVKIVEVEKVMKEKNLKLGDALDIILSERAKKYLKQ